MTSVIFARRWWALALLCAAQFIVILDTSIIGIALPAIQRALGFSQAGLQWVFNAYVVVFGGLLLLGGRLGDLFGHRRVFMAGFGILVLGSLAAGLASTDTVLVASRGVQGLGAALISPAALSIVMSVFTEPRELTKALGFWGASAAAGGTAGVFLGGVITQWASWRWAFLINVPLGALVLVVSPSFLPKGRRMRGALDSAGGLSVTGALVIAVYAIVTGADAGWTSLRTLSLLGTAGVLLVAFLVIQLRRREPLVPLNIFAAPNLSAGNLVMALLGAAWIPMWFFLNLYLQQVLGYSAIGSGLALLPMTVMIMVLMVGITARIVNRFGFAPTLVVGLLLLGVAIGLLSLAPTTGTFVLHVLPASLLGALGMSLAYIPAMIAGTSGASPAEAGLASGLINTSYQIGSALGLAVMTAMAGGATASQSALGAPTATALNAGFQAAFVGAAVTAVGAVVISVLAIRQRSS